MASPIQIVLNPERKKPPGRGAGGQSRLVARGRENLAGRTGAAGERRVQLGLPRDPQRSPRLEQLNALEHVGSGGQGFGGVGIRWCRAGVSGAGHRHGDADFAHFDAKLRRRGASGEAHGAQGGEDSDEELHAGLVVAPRAEGWFSDLIS